MPLKPFKAPKTTTQKYSPVKLKEKDFLDGIAVRSPNWLGDAAMSLPAMYSLKKLLPESCGFFVVTPENLVTFYESMPWVDYILPIGDGHSPLTKEQLKSLKRLKAGVGMLFVNSLKSAYYFKKAGIKKIYGASNGIRNFFLSKPFKVKWNKKNDYESCHQSYKYLNMVYALGAPKWGNNLPPFNIPEDSDLKKISKEKNILLIQPGAAYGPAKRWPEKFFGEICSWWIKEKKGKVVLVGTEQEQQVADDVIKFSAQKEKIINITGKTSLIQLMYIIKVADLCLCNDSGVMHLASVLSKKGVAIFGSTDPYATGPICGEWIVLLNKQSCSPCFSRKCINLEKNYKCLNSITPDQVKKALNYFQ